MIVLFVVFAAVVVVLAVADRFRPGRGARRPARTTPSWLSDGGGTWNAGSAGGDAGGGSGGGSGGGCGDGGGGGGGSC